MQDKQLDAFKQEALEWASEKGLSRDWRWWEPSEYFDDEADQSCCFVITCEGAFYKVMNPDSEGEAMEEIYSGLKREFAEIVERHGLHYEQYTNVVTTIWPR